MASSVEERNGSFSFLFFPSCLELMRGRGSKDVETIFISIIFFTHSAELRLELVNSKDLVSGGVPWLCAPGILDPLACLIVGLKTGRVYECFTWNLNG